MTKRYMDQTPGERVLGADTVRVELTERQYGGFSYRFLALKAGKILDIVELAVEDWDLGEAVAYVRNDRWIAANTAELDITDRVRSYA